MATRATEVLRRFDAAELSLCLQLNRACAQPQVREFFRAISRLGDGALWYALMLVLPLLYGAIGRQAALQMVITGLVGVGLYKGLKRTLARERPFISDVRIELGTMPLDRYSFPSGHTLHAVSFTILAGAYFPELTLLLVPFAILVAASRVFLGLHYPSDVLAGALLGTLLSTLSLYLVGT